MEVLRGEAGLGTVGDGVIIKSDTLLKCPLDGLVERCGAMSYQVGLGAEVGVDDMAFSGVQGV